MATIEQEQKPADADVGWVDLTASDKTSYRVKASDYNLSEVPEADANEVSASGPSFSGMTVNWTVGSEGSPTQDQQNESAITWYKLSKTAWWNAVYSWELSINAKDTYNYQFTDGTGDTYQLNTFQNQGTHYVQFNSSDPTIRSVAGS